MKDRMQIAMGALVPSIQRQLDEQGIWGNLPEDSRKKVDHLNQDSDAITRLAVREIITSGEAAKSRKRLMKKITATIQNGLEDGE